MIGNTFLALSLAELTSAWPTASGSYHWVSQIIPETAWFRRFSVWITGWTNLVAWWMMTISATILGAQCVMAGAIIVSTDTSTNIASFEPERWQTWLVYIGYLVTGALFNTFCIKIIPTYTKITMYWSVAAFVVFVIVIVSTTDNDKRADASWVFGGFENTANWADGMAWLMGMAQTSALCFTGYDSIVHMVEELPNPSVAAPFAIIFTPITGGITGFLFLIALLFQVSDIESAQNAFVALAEIAFTSAGKAGGVILTMFIAIGLGVGTWFDTMTCSRLTYALARDKAYIFPTYFNNVNPRYKVPVRAVWVSAVIVGAIGAIYIGSVSAFNAIIGGCVIFINWSYIIPVIWLMIYGRDRLGPRPFNLGKFGYPVNIIAILYGLFTAVLNFFPFGGPPVTSEDMNYVVVVFFGIYILLLGYWFIWAKDLFVVPKMEIVGALTYSADGDVAKSSSVGEIVSDDSKIRCE